MERALRRRRSRRVSGINLALDLSMLRIRSGHIQMLLKLRPEGIPS
jgi:hypothetical protein